MKRLEIEELRPGDHLCCLYETDEEHRAVLTPFLRCGLERNEKVIYIVDARTAEAILEYLHDAGVDVEPYLRSGQLVILTRDDAYMREGTFNPEGMIALLRAETERALDEGYAALRVTGEMSWALRGLPGSERLIEYEAKLNEFFPGSKCLAICQYDRRRFEPAVLLDVLRTHPIAVIGTETYENFYYVPPAELFGPDIPAVELRRWLENLAARKRAEEALRESEEQYRMVMEHANEAIVVAQDNRLKLVTPKAVELTGYSEAELTSLSFLDFIHPDDRAMVLERYQKRLRGEEFPHVYPFRFLRKDGTIRWVEINAVGIIWAGRPATLNFLTDITERRKADEELEERRRELSERVKELNCLYGLSKLVEKRDLSLEAILEGCVELFPPAYLYPEITCARIVAEGKEFRSKNFKATPWKLSSTLRLRNEPIGAVEVYYLEEQPELDEGSFLQEERKLLDAVAERLGKIIERKRAEDALRESENKYKTLVENIPQKIFIKDINSIYVSCNENYARDLKIKSNEIVGKTDYDFHSRVLADKYRADDKRVIESGKEEELEEKYIADGREVWVKTIKTPVKDENGDVIGVLGIFWDITERKQAEEDRARLLKELEAKNRELERFTYTVSHDLRSPLVTIQGFTAMLQADLEQNKREKAGADLQYITKATSKMGELLSATLKLSRIGRIANPPEDVPFGTIVEGALEQTSGELHANTVEVSVAKDFPVVHVDRTKLEEALVNLIGNSVKYRGEQPHPKIEIGHRKDGRETVFFVKDNGIGIDKSEQEKVFELFYKVDKSSEGTGTGLAIVKRIVEVHGGRIWIESEKGNGCTVCFTLPVV